MTVYQVCMVIEYRLDLIEVMRGEQFARHLHNPPLYSLCCHIFIVSCPL